MFIGHYATAVHARATRRLPLWCGFLLAHLPDLLMATICAPLQLEAARVVWSRPGWTKIVIDYAPFTHGLCGAALGSAVTFVIIRATHIIPPVLAYPAAALYLSHFLCDILVHGPHLHVGFTTDGHRIGLGLWAVKFAGTALEICMVVFAWSGLRSQLVNLPTKTDGAASGGGGALAKLIVADAVPMLLITIQLFAEVVLSKDQPPAAVMDTYDAEGRVKDPMATASRAPVVYSMLSLLAYLLVDRPLRCAERSLHGR